MLGRARTLAGVAPLAAALSAACSPPAAERPASATSTALRPAPTSSPPAPPLTADSKPPASSTPVAPAPPRDPVDVALGELAERLVTPLVSADRRLVARFVGAEGEDTDRVTPLQILDLTSDRAVRSVTFRRGDASDEKLARLSEARDALQEHAWEALVALEVTDDADAPKRQFGLGEAVARVARGDGLVVRFREPTLLVTGASGATLLRRAFPAWSGRKTVSGQPCVVYADLLQAWGSRAAGVLVVEITYSTTPHFCSVQPSTHAVRLPAK